MCSKQKNKMSSLIRLMYRQGYYFQNITKPVKWSSNRCFSRRILCFNANCREFSIKPLLEENRLSVLSNSARYLSNICNEKPIPEPPKKPGLVQRFKQLSKDYWYVILPVHMTTSAIWFGGFYYCVRSGVDVISLLESVGISQKVISPLKDSSAGYFALAFALYKLATPLRYTVTLGATTYAIRKFTVLGWIKPMPSPERLKEMLQEKKDNIQDKFTESKQHYQTQLKEKKSQVLEEMRRYKQEMRNTKNNAKKM